MDVLAIHPHLVPARVDLHAVAGDHAVAVVSHHSGLRRPAQGRLDAGDEHPRAERLGHVVVRAAAQAGDDVVLLALGGEHDHRQRAGGLLLAHRPADLDAVAAGQHQVEHHGVEPLAAEQLQGLLAGVGAGDVEAGADQVVADQLLDVGVVLDDEYGWFVHVPPSGGWCCLMVRILGRTPPRATKKAAANRLLTVC